MEYKNHKIEKLDVEEGVGGCVISFSNMEVLTDLKLEDGYYLFDGGIFKAKKAKLRNAEWLNFTINMDGHKNHPLYKLYEAQVKELKIKKEKEDVNNRIDDLQTFPF